jgi:hypothetical protein
LAWIVKMYRYANRPGLEGLVQDVDWTCLQEESRWNARPLSGPVPTQPAPQTRIESPLKLRSTCPTHPLIDTRTVAQPIQAYLHHRGLQEFVPALALVGITTSEQFLEFCGLDEAEKVNLFGDGRVLCVTPFQRSCLKVELSQARLGAEGFKTRFLP